ncbi:MAG: hypothetical protein K2Y35_05925 [Burkholderiales bacterium]|nr:hypothetical protein [Burkholderiales bacterium]
MKSWCVGATAMLLSMSLSAAQEQPAAADPLEAVTKGRLLLNLRPRVEWVDQDGKAENATAFTNRTLLGWQTAVWKGLSATAQLIDVANFNDTFNEGPAASPRYPTIADPDNTDLNQIYLDYTGLPDTRVRFGKQSVKLDNVRFVGNVEFRQVMQVLSGAMVENRSLPNVELNYAHFDRIKNVYAIQRQTDIDLVRAAWTWRPDNILVGFAYFQDQPDTGQVTGFSNNSNRIAGVRANGAWPVGTMKVLYTAELARQDSYAGGDGRIDASYSRIGAGVGFGKSFVRVDYDRLGSNAGVYGFQTPLGTNHLFQGWADLFLTTPAQGIRDVYLSAGTALWDMQLITEVHDFRSDFGSIHYGSEVDLGASHAFTKQITGKLEFAYFQESDRLAGTARKPDTTKIWVTLIYQW